MICLLAFLFLCISIKYIIEVCSTLCIVAKKIDKILVFVCWLIAIEKMFKILRGGNVLTKYRNMGESKIPCPFC